MTRVLIHSDAAEAALATVAARHPGLNYATCETYQGLGEAVALHQPEVVYTSRFDPGPFPRTALDAASIRWISNAGSGVNHLAPWDPARVTVTNSAGVAAEAMAEFALAAMLHCATGRPVLAKDQAARRWRARMVKPLYGQTLLSIGLGATGRRMAAVGAALGMPVWGVRASGAVTPGVERVFTPDRLAEGLAEADQILVCIPLTDATRGLIGAKALAAVKPGAVLVDLSRGGIVDPDALVEALEDGRLAGAALDVFETEPLPAESPLWARDDILISPHCSGVWAGWEARSVEMFAENLARWLAGAALENVVDPMKGY